MDTLPLNLAGPRPIPLRIALGGEAGGLFDTLLRDTRDRPDPIEPGIRDEPADATPRDPADDEPPGLDPPDYEHERQAMAERPGYRDGPNAETPRARPDQAAESTRDRSAAETKAARATTAPGGQGSTADETGGQTRADPGAGQRAVQLASSGPARGAGPAQGIGPAQGFGSGLRTAVSPPPVFLPPQGALGGQAALAAQNTLDGASESAARQNKAVTNGNTGGVAKKAAAATRSGSARAPATVVGTSAKPFGLPATGGASPAAPGGQPPGTPILAAPALTQSAAATPGSGLAAARPAAGSSGVAQQVAIRIYKAAEAGQERINIRLHPAELGRIEVRMEWAEDGVLRATISAEKSETLDLLQRDSRALDRALQEAGIKTNSGSLSFDLRGHAEGGGRFAESGDGPLDRSGPDGADPGAVEDVGETAPRRAAHDGVLDLSI